MDLSLLIQSLAKVVSGFIAIEKMKAAAGGGTADDAQIAATVEGDIKHFARTKVGWAIDFLWPYLEPEVGKAIVSELQVERQAAPAPVPRLTLTGDALPNPTQAPEASA